MGHPVYVHVQYIVSQRTHGFITPRTLTPPSLRDNVTLICFLHLGLLQSHLLSHFAFNKLSHIAADVIPIPQMSNLSPCLKVVYEKKHAAKIDRNLIGINDEP